MVKMNKVLEMNSGKAVPGTVNFEVAFPFPIQYSTCSLFIIFL